MREIQAPEKAERKRSQGKLIAGLVLIALMVFSTAGYALFSQPTDSTLGPNGDGKPYYNGQYWAVPYGAGEVYLISSPDEVANVSVETGLTLDSYQGMPVFIVSSSDVITREIAGALTLSASRIQEACYGACDDPDLPEKNCTETLIVWNSSAENRVYQQDNCVFIDGDTTAVDAFIYRLLGY